MVLIGLDSIAGALILLDEYRRRGGEDSPIWEVACQLRAHGYPETGRKALYQHLARLDAQPTDPETQRGLRSRKAFTLYLLGWNTAWRAAIAAILGEEEQAVSLLWQAYRDGFATS